VARKLQPFTKRLRGFSRDAVPTIQDLNAIISRGGPDNDLIELTALQDPLAAIGVGPVNRNGASRPGTLPASADAVRDSLTALSTLRAYSPELTGWFDDFGHSGFPDAFGGIGRISTTLNVFTPSLPNLDVCGVLDLPPPIGSGLCQLVDPAQVISEIPGIKFNRRCPGANERGLTEEQLTQGGTIDCDPSQTPVGP
jgi:phospholipid/cholesterol/gamma-HCH transport system substrate-binding protein